MDRRRFEIRAEGRVRSLVGMAAVILLAVYGAAPGLGEGRETTTVIVAQPADVPTLGANLDNSEAGHKTHPNITKKGWTP